jgi:hypothetical protein
METLSTNNAVHIFIKNKNFIFAFLINKPLLKNFFLLLFYFKIVLFFFSSGFFLFFYLVKNFKNVE